MYGTTDRGKVRTMNQDSLFYGTNANQESIMIVCDGIGGGNAGDVASFMAKEVLAKEFENKEIAVAKDTSLYDAMKENFEIKDEDGFITSIAGKEQDAPAQKYWTFTLNEEQVNEGAKDVTLKDRDKVIFNLAAM